MTPMGNDWLQGLDLSQLDPELFGPTDLWSQGSGSFGSTGSAYDIAYQPDLFSSIIAGIAPGSEGEEDQLDLLKKRADLYKLLQGLQFDSRTGYMAAVNNGAPTFNFPGLTAGQGVEQAGTAEAGSGNVVVGIDEDGEPILQNLSQVLGGGGGTGGGGGSSRSSGPSMAEAERFLGSLQNSNSELMRLAWDQVVNKRQDPASTKILIGNSKYAQDMTDEQLKMVYDSVDQAYQYAGVTAAGPQLPKPSDLGIQVGKWGTVDPSLSYTPDTLPEDILDQLGPDYLSQLDWDQSQWDSAQENWNQWLKGNQDSFGMWAQNPEVSRADAGLGPRRFGQGDIPKAQDFSHLSDVGQAPSAGNPMGLSERALAEAKALGSAAPTGMSQMVRSAQTGIMGENNPMPLSAEPIVDALFAATNSNRGDRTPYKTNRVGELLDQAVDITEEEAKALGIKGEGINKFLFQATPGNKRKLYTTSTGANALKQYRGRKETYDRNVQSNQILRQMIAGELANRGRTPQSDDMRNRSASLRQALGF